jgi:hypothetical protein
MRFGLTCAFVPVMLLATTIPSFAGPRVHRGPTSPKLFKERGAKSSHSKTAAVRGIDPERATQIQTALVKSGYLTGTPSGVWDQPTQAAMEKLQADNGWQTKLVPDSRAIIKLGLGPNNSANTTVAAGEASESVAGETAAEAPGTPNQK